MVRSRTTSRSVVAPTPQLVEPERDSFIRSILTDHDGDFDAGAVLVVIVILFMCFASGVDVLYYAREFNAERFGFGIAGVLGGFAAYKFGDAKSRPTTKTTVTATSTTEEGKP